LRSAGDNKKRIFLIILIATYPYKVTINFFVFQKRFPLQYSVLYIFFGLSIVQTCLKYKFFARFVSFFEIKRCKLEKLKKSMSLKIENLSFHGIFIFFIFLSYLPLIMQGFDKGSY